MPSNLRKQRHHELGVRFFLLLWNSRIEVLISTIKQSDLRPFEPKKDAIVVRSCPVARSKADDVHSNAWDLVVIEEAR